MLLQVLVLFVGVVDRVTSALFTPLVDNRVKYSEKDVAATKTTMDCVLLKCTDTASR